tara:strand:- start:108 stop:272 length:165 start_codon:yes stop_codon:yes gene_type:complete
LLFKGHGLFVWFVDELSTGVLLNVKFYGYRVFMLVLMVARLEVIDWYDLRVSYL